MAYSRSSERGSRSIALACTASLLLLLLLLLSQSVDASRTPESPAVQLGNNRRGSNGYSLRGLRSGLDKRGDTEHVVLADCRDTEGVFSSQVAYFPGPPDDQPQDVAVVVTKPGQLRVWAGQTTHVLFTSTGVNFTAVLGPQVPAGQFAGTGFNDYVNFTCWNRFVQELYVYDGRKCSMAYDCSHEAVPAANATATPTATATDDGAASQTSTGSSSTAKPSTSGQSQDAHPSQGLSRGALIGVVVGAVAAGLIAAGAAVFICVHKRRARAKAAAEREAAEREAAAAAAAAAEEASRQPPPGTPGWVYSGTDKKDAWLNYASGSPYSQQSSMATPPPPFVVRHELDGHWRGAEIVGDGSHPELGGREMRAELEGRGRRTVGPDADEISGALPHNHTHTTS